MNQELKEKWINALRSGTYQQGKSVLRSDDEKWCCLGVLCDVSGEGEWIEKPDQIATSYFYKTEKWEKALYTPDGEFGLLDSHKLAVMNDEGKSFEEITTFIETTL